MAERIPQSIAKLVVFRAFLASTGLPATGKTIAITLSKNGATSFSNPAAGVTNATEIASGFYKVALDIDDTDTLGPLALRGAEGTILDVGEVFEVTDELSTLCSQTSFDNGMAFLAVTLASLPADLRTQFIEALTLDSYAEPTGVPPATASLERKVGQLYKHLINEHRVTAIVDTLRNDDGSDDILANLSDDGTTGTRTQWSDA